MRQHVDAAAQRQVGHARVMTDVHGDLRAAVADADHHHLFVLVAVAVAVLLRVDGVDRGVGGVVGEVGRVVVPVGDDEGVVVTDLARAEGHPPDAVRQAFGALHRAVEVDRITQLEVLDEAVQVGVHLAVRGEIRVVPGHREIAELVQALGRVHVHAVPHRGVLPAVVEGPDAADTVAAVEAVEGDALALQRAGHGQAADPGADDADHRAAALQWTDGSHAGFGGARRVDAGVLSHSVAPFFFAGISPARKSAVRESPRRRLCAAQSSSTPSMPRTRARRRLASIRSMASRSMFRGGR